MNNKKMSISKQIVSITEISKMVQLSRARFYQLLQSGFFPKPLYDDRSKRPYYDINLQQKCLECRQSGVGVDGSFMLFYSPRKKETTSRKNGKKIEPHIQEMTETLESMGLKVSGSQVDQALQELYPDGFDNGDIGVVIRDLFRHFKK